MGRFDSAKSPYRTVAAAGVALGFGLGGFFDGILLHQVLQWHHLLSGLENAALSLPNQILADGAFHILMYLVTLVGLALLWSHRSGDLDSYRKASIARYALIGFGTWHILDAVLSHWLLGLHRVRMDVTTPLAWDLGWLAIFGIVPLIAGLMSRKPPTIGRGGTAALLVVVVAAAGLNAFPIRANSSIVTAVFPAGASSEVFQAIIEVDGKLIWNDRTGQVWTIELADGVSPFRLYSEGALLVSGTYFPKGCFDWVEPQG